MPQFERAVQVKRSPENLSALANFLAFPGPNRTAIRESQQRALDLMKEAVGKTRQPEPCDLFLTAQIAGQLQNEMEFRQATRQMLEKFPDLAGSHYLNAICATMDERWTEAEDEIRRAEQLGLPSDIVKQFLDSGVHRRAQRLALRLVFTVSRHRVDCRPRSVVRVWKTTFDF